MPHILETRHVAGPDKLLHLQVPVDDVGKEYRVTVTVEKVDAVDQPLSKWPEGYIESTYRSWQGEFERPPQGSY